MERETPGTGGVKRGTIEGRAGGGAGGATGGVTAGAIGGVTLRAIGGVTLRATGTAGVGATGVTGAATSGIAGISPVVRDARAITPGVNVGVGLRRCGGGENGVANGTEGSESRAGGGVTRGASTGSERRGGGGSKASGAASASDSITARSFAAHPPATGTAPDGRAGVAACGAACAA